LLIERGALPWLVNCKGRNALYYVLKKKFKGRLAQFQIIECLAKTSQDNLFPELTQLLVDTLSLTKAQHLVLLKLFRVAVQGNCVRLMEQLLLMGADINYSYLGHDGFNSLACSLDYERSALHFAIRCNAMEAALLLISKGADINAIEWRREEVWPCANRKRTPLQLACMNGQKEVVRALLFQGANSNEIGNNNWTPLHVAVLNGHKDVVSLLLERSAVIDAVEDEGSTPLYYACWEGHKEIVKFLLSKGANARAVNLVKRTPLHRAVMTNDIEIVKLLLEAKHIIKAKDGEGKTPFEYAQTDEMRRVLKGYRYRDMIMAPIYWLLVSILILLGRFDPLGSLRLNPHGRK
jgi:ankyrin repeat protein